MSRFTAPFDSLRRRLGFDRAIAAHTASHLSRFVTGPITMILIVKFFSPAEQGFYYSFSGVLALQIFLEAGFAQSITQFTSREFSSLRFGNNNCLTGSPEALSRLRSLLQQANRYYRRMAGILILSLSVGGYFFFSSKPDLGVPWLVPWIIVCFGSGLTFLLTPYWALLEGCNRISQVATFRLVSGLLGFVAVATGISLNLGIYVTALATCLSVAMSLSYLFFRWRPLIVQLNRPPTRQVVNWKTEVWGFQWRIALTWVSRYFLEAGLAPLTFQLAGPAAAGKVGITFQIVKMVVSVSSSWTLLKVPHWGALSAKGAMDTVNREWKKNAVLSWLLCGVGMIAFILILGFGLPRFPEYVERFLPLRMSLGFVAGWFLYAGWLACSHYTRALRREPYTFLHMAVGISFLILAITCYGWLGLESLSLAFAAVHLPALFVALKVRSALEKSPMESGVGGGALKA